MTARTSKCSAGQPLDFVWAGNPAFTGAEQIDRAVQAFTYVITSVPTLHWDPVHLAITRREFRDRITRGQNGRLIPVTQVAEIGRAANEYVFEIKYDFSVVSVSADGMRTTRKMRTRLYISEPPQFPTHFVGLHVHEKATFPEDHRLENDMQNREIDTAVRYYEAGRPSNWGI